MQDKIFNTVPLTGKLGTGSNAYNSNAGSISSAADPRIPTWREGPFLRDRTVSTLVYGRIISGLLRQGIFCFYCQVAPRRC
jgi:hypothetical protein